MQGTTKKIGLLLTNLGTPDAPTTPALRRYLKEFLWDIRVIDLNRILWWLILNGIILRTRPQKSAHAYQNIWAKGGSPLMLISRAQVKSLARKLRTHGFEDFSIALGMRYGNPSIASALEKLRESGCSELIILPLYPQYAGATVGSTYDAVAAALTRQRVVPKHTFINSYHTHPLYIQALATSIERYWRTHGRPDKLLFSYHGLPKRYVESGDPYQKQCEQTTALVIEKLRLSPNQWALCYQSRFGKEPWIEPYADEVIPKLAQDGARKLHMIAPGFSVDCLETLEEIGMQYRELFESSARQSGGGTPEFGYIPCLNNQSGQIELLAQLVLDTTLPPAVIGLGTVTQGR